MFLLPFENAPQKFLAPKIVARLVLCPPQIFLHRGLRSDSSVIHPGQPKDFESLHPRATNENILNGIVEHMAEREHPSNVWRWHYNGK